MEVFVEQGPSYEVCLKKIYDKHGDAVRIIRKKDSRVSKFFGLFERDVVEVLFSLSEDSKKQAQPRKYDRPTSAPQPPLNDKEERIKIMQSYAEKNPSAAQQLKPYLTGEQDKKNTVPIQNEKDDRVEELLDTVKELVVCMNQQKTVSEQEHANIVKIRKLLEENDFGASYISELCSRLKNELSYVEIENFQVVQEKLFNLLAESLDVIPPPPQDKTRVITVIGTTGVGKTTTLAKIAAQYVLKNDLKVRVLTIDIWRIGAVSQMERYCEVMEIDLTVASNPTEFRAYMDIYREETDVICIDTTGRSPKDREKLTKMREFFDALNADAEIYLAVSAGTRINDVREIMNQYEIFKYKSLIITKFDETSYIGNLFTIIAETKIPVTYLTTGQNVPQDLMIADRKIFLEKLKGFTVDPEYIHFLCNKNDRQSAADS